MSPHLSLVTSPCTTQSNYPSSLSCNPPKICAWQLVLFSLAVWLSWTCLIPLTLPQWIIPFTDILRTLSSVLTSPLHQVPRSLETSTLIFWPVRICREAVVFFSTWLGSVFHRTQGRISGFLPGIRSSRNLNISASEFDSSLFYLLVFMKVPGSG